MRLWLTILFLCCCGIISAQTYHIGDVYTAPDGSKGIVYYIHPDGSGGWVVALTDASDGCAWGAATDVPGLTNQNSNYYQNLLNDTAGYANTQTLRSYQNNNTSYAAGKVDFAHGWVLPSPAQLRMLYGQLPFIATAITNAGGTALTSYDYWCSAENSASNAWVVNFSYGWFTSVAKTTSCRVRAVRSFSLTSVVYDTALTYQWSTGSTQPYVNVNPSQTTNYQVTATTDYGCSTTAEQTILVGTGSAQTIYDTVCQGTGYEANGFSITEAETQTAGTLTRSRTLSTSGCSSNLTLQLRVNEPVASTCSATACERYEWNGVTYYESGEYTQTFTAANGCDSVVTLHLLINHGTHNGVTVDTCDSYTWHGMTYTVGGTYMYDYSNASDCSSTDTLYLTINQGTRNVVTIDTCDSYTWHGTTYTTSGTYHYDYTNASGCSSTDTLHLIITKTPEVNIIVTADTICVGDSVTLQADAEQQLVFPIAVGSILCTDSSIVSPSEWPVAGKTAMGIVFYVDSTGEHGWAVHIQNQGSYMWASYGTDVVPLPNYSFARVALTDMDGYTNTQIIANNAYCPAVNAVDMAHGWYLPAIGQLNLLFAEMVTMNASLQVVGGTQFSMDSDFYYWSSTECGYNWSWYLHFNGILDYCAKTYKHIVRSVRNF